MSKSQNQVKVNVGDKLDNAGVAGRRTDTPYSSALKANVLTELKKPGAKVPQIAARFKVGVGTVYGWRLAHVGRMQTRANTRSANQPVVPSKASATAPPIDVRSMAAALGSDREKQEDCVTLTRQEARTLALLVRDTVKRMAGADELTLGRLAILALKLVG